MYLISPTSKDHSESNEKIHSGQFMISKYDEESDSEDLHNYDDNEKGYNFNSGSLKKNFQFTERVQYEPKKEIEYSLNTMFEFLSIAMTGKITNPKWNPFKGVQFQPKDKIRLNNIIWREYHMQFVKKLKPVVVQFASPLSETLQVNGNVVLEGKYWKRTSSIIIHQYNKWRTFYKHRVAENFQEMKKAALFDSILVQRNLYNKMSTNSPLRNLNDIFMDLDDFNLPIDDISGVQHNSQIMQPQLTNLQPRMESSLDFLNDYFCAPQKTMRSQKAFSSETCLNINPRTNNHGEQEYCSRMLPPGSDFVVSSSKVNKRKMEGAEPPSREYQCRPFLSEGKDLIPDGGLCKTPNLLSILLQPIVSEDKQGARPRQMCTLQPDLMTSEPSQQLRAANAAKYASLCHMSRTGDGPVPLPDKYNVAEPGYSERFLLNQKCGRSSQYSVHQQSIQMKHSLTATNAVQQHLDELSSLLLSIRDQNKISKAALLHKASEHIKRLRVEKHRLQSEMIKLQTEIDTLQNKFSAFCSQLPANGVCLNDNKSSEGKKWFEDFVAKRSVSNWKFYIFSMMLESLFTGYNGSVSTSSMESLVQTVASWLEKECSLMKLRLVVINGMRTLSRRTSIVHNPRKLEEEIKNLIDASNQPGKDLDSRVWSVQPTEEIHVRMHPDQGRYPKSRNTTNSWPQVLSLSGRTSNSLDRHDV